MVCGVYSEGRYLLKEVESNLKLQAMSQWMRQHMGVDPSDTLSDADMNANRRARS